MVDLPRSTDGYAGVLVGVSWKRSQNIILTPKSPMTRPLQWIIYIYIRLTSQEEPQLSFLVSLLKQRGLGIAASTMTSSSSLILAGRIQLGTFTSPHRNYYRCSSARPLSSFPSSSSKSDLHNGNLIISNSSPSQLYSSTPTPCDLLPPLIHPSTLFHYFYHHLYFLIYFIFF